MIVRRRSDTGFPLQLVLSEKFWIIGESNSDTTYYYKGYYEKGRPVFSMAIIESLHIAWFENAKELFNFLNKKFPCEIWLVENNNVTKVL
ncbi:hypothetical protein DBR40_24010 [Pedobacter sp. KBW01]|nr:hypothetical protein DBR40_24010 [Pedobacter sp. KBW01]